MLKEKTLAKTLFTTYRLDSNSAITMGDLKESFYISPNALSAKRQTLPEVMKPSQDGLEKLDAECMRVCLVLLEAFAKALKVRLCAFSPLS